MRRRARWLPVVLLAALPSCQTSEPLSPSPAPEPEPEVDLPNPPAPPSIDPATRARLAAALDDACRSLPAICGGPGEHCAPRGAHPDSHFQGDFLGRDAPTWVALRSCPLRTLPIGSGRSIGPSTAVALVDEARVWLGLTDGHPIAVDDARHPAALILRRGGCEAREEAVELALVVGTEADDADRDRIDFQLVSSRPVASPCDGAVLDRLLRTGLSPEPASGGTLTEPSVSEPAPRAAP